MVRAAGAPGVSREEVLHACVNRLYYSEIYSTVYLTMIVLNIVIIAWMLVMPSGYDGNLLFLLLQLVVNLVLVVEVVVRLVSLRGRFFAECSNVFDLTVMLVAIVAQILYIHPPEVAAAAVTTEEWADVSASALRIVRDGVLFFRLLIFIKNKRKNVIIDEELVDFSTVREPLLAKTYA